VSGSRRARARRALAAVALSAAGVVVLAPGMAHAQAISPVCDAFATDTDGNPTGTALSTGNSLPPLNIPSLGQGASVTPGTAFTVNTAGTKVTLPAVFTTKVGTNDVTVGVVEVKNIVMAFTIGGAAAVGAPKLAGGTVLGAQASATQSSFTLTLPGSKHGSKIPKGSAFFPGGATFSTPAISMPVTAPKAPGTITTSLATMKMLVEVLFGGQPLTVALDCTAPPNTVGSVGVQLPGAPGAVDDAASTTPGSPVTIDVLANDKPNALGTPPDPATLAIVTAPGHGSATPTAGHEVRYEPDSTFTTSDTFTYRVCAAVAQPTTTTTASTTSTTAGNVARRLAATPPPGSELVCATAVVTVSAVHVEVAPTTSTSVATLPRTGGSSTPLALAGAGLCALGLAAIGLVARRGREHPARVGGVAHLSQIHLFG